ncbi:hypothetical protein [Tenacibaculum ovolyticum]|nr:hypothetical protein [Tenacibaculum ovolyticum]
MDKGMHISLQKDSRKKDKEFLEKLKNGEKIDFRKTEDLSWDIRGTNWD